MDTPHAFLPDTDTGEEFFAYDLMFTPEFFDQSITGYNSLETLNTSFILYSLFQGQQAHRPYFSVSGSKFSVFGELFNKIYLEHREQRIGYLEIIRAYLLQLLVLTFRLALLTSRSVLPLAIFEWFEEYVGKGNLLDAQEIYCKIKYEKSDIEMALTRQAAKISDVMMEGMLAVMQPGMLQTQVAQWGYAIASELGAEELGFDVMVTSGEDNRSIVGKALNHVINEGDFVHLGVGPCMDGLHACTRHSVVCTGPGGQLTESQKYWLDFVDEAYQVGLDAYIEVAKNNLPARLQHLVGSGY